VDHIALIPVDVEQKNQVERTGDQQQLAKRLYNGFEHSDITPAEEGSALAGIGAAVDTNAENMGEILEYVDKL
jgi:hypothetical protein